MEKTKRDCKKAILILVVLLAVFCMADINPIHAIEVVGANTGLRVNVSDVLVPTDNLAPGDTKTSTMTISIDPESNTSSLRVWIRAEIIEYVLGKEVNGIRGNLDDKLVLTVTHKNGKVLHNGPISKFNENVLIGDIKRGNRVDLTFTVHLPGETTGNEYQGSSLTVKWIITAQYEPSEKPTPTRPPLSPPTQPPSTRVTTVPTQPPAEPTEPVVPTEQVTPTPTPKIVDIEDEEIPVGPAKPDTSDESDGDGTEIIIIKEEEIPKGLPKTGELPPILFYGLGAGAVYAGMKLNQKKRKQ